MQCILSKGTVPKAANVFKYVHHVHYVVENRDAMVDYFEKNFGMKPVYLGAHPNRKEALYDVGETQIHIVEPLDRSSHQGQHLAMHGPGVYHVAWAVDNIRKVAQELAAKGSKTRRRGKEISSGQTFESTYGYLSFNIEPSSSYGVLFQLSEARVSR